MPVKAEDLTGRVYGNWTVLERVSNSKGRKIMYACRCTCDAVRSVQAGNLVSGRSRGCTTCAARRANAAHHAGGMSAQPVPSPQKEEGTCQEKPST